jgi:hypothetical protein
MNSMKNCERERESERGERDLSDVRGKRRG